MGRMGVTAGAVYVQTMPLFHTSGSAMGVLGCLSHLNTMVLVDAFEPGPFWLPRPTAAMAVGVQPC